MRRSLQWFLVMDAGIRLLIWSTAFILATAIWTALGAWPKQSPVSAGLYVAWLWGNSLAWWVVVYNMVYVAELIVLRLLIPTPKPGRYSTTDRRLNRQLLWSSFLAVLTKARLQPPFPAFLVHHVASLPPLRWLVEPIFGPRSKSCNVTDPKILDPHLVRIGRNVVIGIDATLAGHIQDRESVTLSPTIVEDDVVIGGFAVIPGGIHIKSGSMIGLGAVIRPDTVIGPNEFWAGVPAKKIADLRPTWEVDAEQQSG
jgi:hypothetical protein